MATAIILAGGLGTRLREKVPDRPKPMAPIRGIPFLEFQIDFLRRNHFQKVIFSIGHLAYQIQDYFGSSFGGLSVQYAVEENPLGTGGAVQLASELVTDEAFVLLNGDTWMEWDVAQALALHQANHAEATLILRRQTDPNRFGGVEVDSNNRVTKFAAKGEPSQWMAAGAYWWQTRSWQHLPFGNRFSLETDLLPWMIQGKKPLAGFCVAGADHFIDIGLPHDFDRAQDVLPKLPRE